jgi:hypothetical protein
MSRKKKKINFVFEYFNKITFSPFVGEEMELGPEIFVAGKRSRFNRIGLVSFVDVEDLDGINKRLVIDGAEQGNEISISIFTK